jgi:hypothetical protein
MGDLRIPNDSIISALHLVKVLVQGKHRFYSLEGPDVATALEGLSVLAGALVPSLCPARPAGSVPPALATITWRAEWGVLLHDRFRALGWLAGSNAKDNANAYDLTPNGTKAFEALGIDIEATRTLRRRFACACLDWSERRPHVGGALGSSPPEGRAEEKMGAPGSRQQGVRRHQHRTTRNADSLWPSCLIASE